MSDKIEIDSDFLEYLKTRTEFQSKKHQERNALMERVTKACRQACEETAFNEMETYARSKCGEKGAAVVKFMRILHKHGVPLDETRSCIDELVELFVTFMGEGDDNENQ